MKIILLRDVPGVGKKGEVKEANDGYSKNFLLPRGLAKAATPGGIKEAEERAKVQKTSQEKLFSRSKEAFTKLNETELKISAPANEKGHLFAGVDKKAILEKLHHAGFSEMRENDVELTEPIKQTGEYFIKIEHGSLRASVKLIIKSTAEKK
jgi:large subunit ribosomal protein L9